MTSGLEVAPGFTLPSIRGEPVSLDTLLADGPIVLVFGHADCLTSRMTLRRLGEIEPQVRLACILEEPPEEAARLARRIGWSHLVLAQDEPYEVSQAFDVDTVPSAIRVEPDGAISETVVGWDADALGRTLGVDIPGEPRLKPGCLARWGYESHVTGLDELEDMFERDWTDGLPVVPPTPERVEAMLGGCDPSRVLGQVPPAHGKATLERVAACAVLAGCRPEYFPVVVAAVEAALEPAFNAHGLAATTQPAGPIVVLSGTTAERVGASGEMGALGPGNRANMTIGRALRLVLTLTGGARPGGLDRATLGHPGKLACCFAENDAASPWNPLHVDLGYPADATTLTLFAGDAPHSIADHGSLTPDALAQTFGWAASTHWSPFWWPMDDTSLFVVSPEHVAMFADAGWSRERVREAIWSDVQRPVGELRRGDHPRCIDDQADDAAMVHKWPSPENIVLVVAGAHAGRYSAVFGPADEGVNSKPVTKEVVWST